MHILFLIGRIAFVLVFLASGVFKLMDIAATAALIESKITIPAALSPVVEKVTSLTGLSAFQVLAIALAVVEIVFALFIIFNVATRFSAFVLAIVILVGTFYVHDFWNMSGDARIANVELAIKNLSIFGGLLMIMVIGAWRPTVDEEEYNYSR